MSAGRQPCPRLLVRHETPSAIILPFLYPVKMPTPRPSPFASHATWHCLMHHNRPVAGTVSPPPPALVSASLRAGRPAGPEVLTGRRTVRCVAGVPFLMLLAFRNQGRSHLPAGTVLDSIGKMMRLDVRRTLQVGDSARQLDASQRGGRLGLSCPVGS
jgi:hypothetical protein